MSRIKATVANICVLFRIMGKAQAFGVVLRFLSAAVNIILPIVFIYFEKKLIQLLQLNTTDYVLLLMAVVSLALTVFMERTLSALFEGINTILNNSLSCKLEHSLYKKFLDSKLYYCDNHEIYEKMECAKRIGTSTVTNYISACFDIIAAIIQFISSAIILYSYSGWLLLMVVLGIIPVVFVRRFTNTYEEFDKKRISTVRRMNYFKTIATDGRYTKETKLFGIIPFICNEHKRLYNSWKKEELEYSDKDDLNRLIWQPVTSLFIFVFPLLFLIWRVSLHTIDVADFSYCINLIALCHGKLTAIVNSFFDNRLGDSRIKDYFDFINMPIASRPGAEIPDDWLKELPEIEFKNVSFSYDQSDKKTVDNISFSIRPKEKIALLGLNGAGKTTLIKLLCGLYEPSCGEILIGGQNIMQFSQVSLYKLFSVVFQDYWNYEMPLVETLSMGSTEKAEISSIKQTFADLGGDEFLCKRFLENYDLSVGKILDESGIELSGGENQKIALARAVLQNRKMLIFDEPTANLDAYSEESILNNVIAHNDSKSIIIVTHRLSVVHYVDRILVMKNGQIIEQGSHEELLKRNGEYKNLYCLQQMQYR